MRKIYSILAIIAVISIAACKKNNPVEPENNSKPSVEDPSGDSQDPISEDPDSQDPDDGTIALGSAIASFVGKPWDNWTASSEGGDIDASTVFVYKTAEELAESSHPEDGNAYAISSYYPTGEAGADYTGYFTSPEYEVPKTGAAFTLKWCYKYGPEDGLTIQVKKVGGEWEDVKMPAFIFQQHGPLAAGYADLKRFAGSKIQIRLKYYGLAGNTGTWYVSDFEILPSYVYIAADGAPEGWTIENAINPPADLVNEDVSCGDSDGSSVWFYRASDGWAAIAPKTQNTFAAMGYTYDANDADATSFFPAITFNGSKAIISIDCLDCYMGADQVTVVDKQGNSLGAIPMWDAWDDHTISFESAVSKGSQQVFGIRYTASSGFPAGTFCVKKVIVASR